MIMYQVGNDPTIPKKGGGGIRLNGIGWRYGGKRRAIRLVTSRPFSVPKKGFSNGEKQAFTPGEKEADKTGDLSSHGSRGSIGVARQFPRMAAES